MGTTTSILSLYKPSIGETGWGANVNTNFDTIDKIGAQVVATTQSGTTYTLALADQGKVVELTSATAVTLTVPTNASVAFPVGTMVGLLQYGAGQVTLSPAGGVTLRSSGSRLKTAAQYSAVWVRKRATDEWVVTGDTAA